MKDHLRRLLLGVSCAVAAQAAAIPISLPPEASARVRYGAERLAAAAGDLSATDPLRIVLTRAPGERESFTLNRTGDGIEIRGGDDSGLLYGCLELARLLAAGGVRPGDLPRTERPAFVLRGPCLGLQKTYILPGRRVYEYPYTPDLFPFFYDRTFWREYLDFLVDHRLNTLYLWNGHPFSSLVRVPGYPDALEVSAAVFVQNVEMFRFITEECDRRGIWLVQMFYNILLPQPLAARAGLPTQLRASTPLAADYTRRALAEFVRQYPNVGLMPCLGEALQGTPNQITWATETILPGVLDGMKAAGLTAQPPVVFRTHAMDPEAIMPAAFKVYANLFTETKFNGESLTTWEPRGRGQATHLAMSRLGPHLVNIHILSNLEPFRYGATEFIRRCVLAARDRLGATGLHLYPLAYWNWPDAPDRADPPLRQWERDWIWFEAWARYAWNPDREPASDRLHWIDRLAAHYGGRDAAAAILDAYNAAGECAPRLIRRFGITEGNRQTLALGMTLDQLVRPEKYGVLPDLWESQSPPGERLPDYVARELAGEPHVGETPPQIMREVREFSQRAVDALARAAPGVTRHRAEFDRLRNDVDCIRALSQHYAAKAGAALHVLRYQARGELSEMERAGALLRASLDHFRTLEQLTRTTYHFANSMQTAQRRIPVIGGEGGRPANFHWSHLLPVYEREQADFEQRLAALKAGGRAAAQARTLATLRAAPFTVHTPGTDDYSVKIGARPFRGSTLEVTRVATELDGLRGIRQPPPSVREGRNDTLEFSVAAPVRVLVGFARSDSPEWRPPPRSETDAAAVERGGTEPLLLAALEIPSLPPIDVYEFSFPAGRHTLNLPGTGAYLLLGFVSVADASRPSP